MDRGWGKPLQGVVVVVAIEAIAGASILSQWIALPPWQIDLVLMLLLTGVNLLSTRSYGEFEFWFSSIKVAAIVVFILIAGAYALGLTSPAGPTLSNLYSHGGFAPYGWLAVLAGMTTVVFSLCGAEIATIAAVESHEPARVISHMTVSISVRMLSISRSGIGASSPLNDTMLTTPGLLMTARRSAGSNLAKQ